ncbi:MAG: PQQ-binding-like beta-propeller repeat protein [Gammaproteobacteria bacterium]|nr:PQQ-binding-like beta-propeller repeat protein [Gammaproteobacteria bacterium]
MYRTNWCNLATAFAVAIAPLFFAGNLSAQVTESNSSQTSWQSANPNIYPPTLDEQTLFVNGERTIEAWDTTNGSRIWSQSLKSAAVFQPRVAGDLLLISGRHDISIYQKRSGKIQWNISANREFSVPLLHKGLLVVGDGHLLMAFNLSTGKQQWEFATTGNARIGYAPIGYGETILLGAGNGVLYSLSVESGELLWKVDRESDWQYLRQLDISNGMLVAGGYHDELFGIDPDSGVMKWRFNAGNFVNSELVKDDSVYFWSPTGWIYALDTTNGKVRWRHRTINYTNPAYPGSWSSIMAEIEADDEHLYILAMDNVLHLLDRKTGEEVACYMVEQSLRPFVTLSPRKGELFFGTRLGELIKTSTSELKSCRFIYPG